MKKIAFVKMEGAGNDFVVIRSPGLGTTSLKKLAIKACDRKFGIGADGLLVLDRSKAADVQMRIFNSDGSEAEMCGNGVRCLAFYASKLSGKRSLTVATKAGVIRALVNGNLVRARLSQPKGIKLDLPVKLGSRTLRVNFINTGVPHAVIFTSCLDKINVRELGELIRHHKVFKPKGTNVDFVEVTGKDSVAVRTYERGVEDETLACGTGSTASALIFALKSGANNKVNVRTKIGEILKIYFKNGPDGLKNVWLEGKVNLVYKGEYNV